MIEQFPDAALLLVRRMTWESDGILSVDLERPDGGQLPEWECGAHVDLIFAADLIRQYSLCSNPADRSTWRIAVLLDDASSGGSRFVHETLRPGMTVLVGPPRNNFALVEAPSYLFIAGGIGVTPLVPMSQAVDRRGGAFRLLYGGRRRESMAFVTELQSFGERTEIWPEDVHGLLRLSSAIAEAGPEAAVYCCGPEPLIAAVIDTCDALGRPAPHVERFSARPGHAQELEAAIDTEFDVVLARSGKRVLVPIGKSIASVLDSAGIFIPTSCTEGYCGTCETRVLSGIPDHRDDYLSDDRRAANDTMMVCMSRSKTPELVLDL